MPGGPLNVHFQVTTNKGFLNLANEREIYLQAVVWYAKGQIQIYEDLKWKTENKRMLRW